MKLTVKDICSFPQLEKMRLIAGRGGLDKQVVHCGILDYEYDRDLASKYYEYNYQMEGFLTLTTFLYAKNDPNLIYDAVKRLVSKNGSGLVIKNIFKLPVSETVIRYADHMDFPIFILNDSYPFFEDIIILINKAMERYDSVNYLWQKLDSLLAGDSDEQSFLRSVFEMDPAMEDDMTAAYFLFNEEKFTPEMYLKIESEMYKKEVIRPEDSVFLYKNGFMLLHTGRVLKQQDSSADLLAYVRAADSAAFECFGPSKESTARKRMFTTGISRIHHTRGAFAKAVREALYACRFADEDDDNIIFYDDLGPYQAILPFAGESAMTDYCQRYLLPLELYDSEKNSNLVKTLTEFVKNGGSLDRTAARMGQHKNTIRYRLRRAGQITRLDPFSLGDYEKLALAVRISICSANPPADQNRSLISPFL